MWQLSFAVFSKKVLQNSIPLPQGRHKTVDTLWEPGIYYFFWEKGSHFQQQSGETCQHDSSDSATGRQPDSSKGCAIIHFSAELELYFQPTGHIKTNYFLLWWEVCEGWLHIASPRDLSHRRTKWNLGWQLGFVGLKQFWRTRIGHTQAWHLGLVNEEKSFE